MGGLVKKGRKNVKSFQKKKNKFCNFMISRLKIARGTLEVINMNLIVHFFDLIFCSSYQLRQSPPRVEEQHTLCSVNPVENP